MLLLLAPAARAADPGVARIAASAERARAPDVRARVETYLESIDTPIPDERWRALGPQAAVVLEEIAQDHSRLPTRRARAVSALGIVGAEGSRQVMLALARNEDEAGIVRTSAIHAAAGMMAGPAAVESLRPLLERAKDPRVRAAAAEAMARRTPTLACPTVQKQVTRERAVQRPAFRRALDVCRR
jgi:HEAT repeat protein